MDLILEEVQSTEEEVQSTEGEIQSTEKESIHGKRGPIHGKRGSIHGRRDPIHGRRCFIHERSVHPRKESVHPRKTPSNPWKTLFNPRNNKLYPRLKLFTSSFPSPSSLLYLLSFSSPITNLKELTRFSSKDCSMQLSKPMIILTIQNNFSYKTLYKKPFTQKKTTRLF